MGFFPFASAQGQNDRKEGQNDIFSCHPEAQAEGSHKRMGFFGRLRNLRITERRMRGCPERCERMTKLLMTTLYYRQI